MLALEIGKSKTVVLQRMKLVNCPRDKITLIFEDKLSSIASLYHSKSVVDLNFRIYFKRDYVVTALATCL
jgi:predicted nuclease of predicted toxin-antitoxin system